MQNLCAARTLPTRWRSICADATGSGGAVPFRCGQRRWGPGLDWIRCCSRGCAAGRHRRAHRPVRSWGGGGVVDGGGVAVGCSGDPRSGVRGRRSLVRRGGGPQPAGAGDLRPCDGPVGWHGRVAVAVHDHDSGVRRGWPGSAPSSRGDGSDRRGRRHPCGDHAVAGRPVRPVGDPGAGRGGPDPDPRALGDAGAPADGLRRSDGVGRPGGARCRVAGGGGGAAAVVTDPAVAGVLVGVARSRHGARFSLGVRGAGVGRVLGVGPGRERRPAAVAGGDRGVARRSPR